MVKERQQVSEESEEEEEQDVMSSSSSAKKDDKKKMKRNKEEKEKKKKKKDKKDKKKKKDKKNRHKESTLIDESDKEDTISIPAPEAQGTVEKDRSKAKDVTTSPSETSDTADARLSSHKKEKKRNKKDKKRKSKHDDKEEEQQEQEQPSSKKARTNVEEPSSSSSTTTNNDIDVDSDINDDPRIVESSALDNVALANMNGKDQGVTLLLFYQYVEPIWSLEKYQQVLVDMEQLGHSLHLTGRMRVAREGLNCTLTSTRRRDMLQFCRTLRQQPEFQTTEFKITNHLPDAQRFPQLKVFQVIELVHYGLEGQKAPPIQEYHGVHLEPKEYHKKIAEKDTVMIDVRNHYEAIIGHFEPPNKNAMLDPLMRKSTEFPVWLDKPETKEKLKGRNVLMYCTGGIRCERATALLKYKMEHDPEIKKLGIQEVYQLQGGIDKYFKEFPDGGFWKGKNYVFDKRFAHKPAAVEGKERRGEAEPQPLSQCEACQKPWDRFRGKRRCPTCGVPSLICKECFIADQKGEKKLKGIRCDLCVKENITSKHQLRTKEKMEIEEYEQKLVQRGLIPQPEAKGERLKVDAAEDAQYAKPPSRKKLDNTTKIDKNKSTAANAVASNPNKVTRLYLKNMCRNSMDETALMAFLPGITHIVWKKDGKTGMFLGQGWVEMATPDDAARAIAKNGQRVLGRPLYINYQPPDSKDVWPPPGSAVSAR